MKQKSKKRKWLSGIIAVVLICVTALNSLKIQSILLESAKTMGDEISHRIALEEMENISPYIQLLEYMEVELRPEDLSRWMAEYLNSTKDLANLSEMDIYASIDGKIVAATHWENDPYCNPYPTEWYQQAIAAQGETIYTDSYVDSRLQIPAVTIAKQISGTQDVLAIDLYFSDIAASSSAQNPPTGSNYFMCDSIGQVLYSVLDNPYPQEQVHTYV